MLRWLLTACFLFCAGVSNGVMDGLQFHFERTRFADNTQYDPQFWNPALSWKNKYKDHDPAKGEAYFGASTFLVFTTDAWHLAKFIMLKFFVLAVLAFGLGRRLYLYTGEEWLQLLGWGFVLTLCYQLGFATSYV
jgi:hypothetical protein